MQYYQSLTVPENDRSVYLLFAYDFIIVSCTVWTCQRKLCYIIGFNIFYNKLTYFRDSVQLNQLESMFPNSNNSNPYNTSTYNPYQQKSSLNIIVFDEEDSRDGQSGVKRQNSYDNLSQSRNTMVIGKQIQTLNEKLGRLQAQTQRLIHQVSYRKTETNFTQVTRNQMTHLAHYDQIISIIEQKIQVVIKETQNIVSKITKAFEKKLQDKQNNPQANISLNIASYQIQARRKMIETVREVQNKYQQELQRLKFQNRQIESQMLVRVNSVQESYALKILDFQRKQRNYIDQIQQLQSKYKKLQNSRSQKKLQLTQEKDRSFTNKINQQKLLPDNINQSKSRQNNLMMPPALKNQINRYENTKNDTSASRNRKHKIFDLKKENRQRSPVPTNQQVAKRQTSPSPISYSQNDNFVNHGNFGKNKADAHLLSTVQPIKPRKTSDQQFLTKGYQKDPNYDYQRNTVSGVGQIQYQRQDIYKEKAHQQKMEGKSLAGPVTLLTAPTASQFYKDIPKADSAWQKFDRKNKNQNSDSQSDEDVFFYAQNPDQQQKLLSPLDIN